MRYTPNAHSLRVPVHGKTSGQTCQREARSDMRTVWTCSEASTARTDPYLACASTLWQTAPARGPSLQRVPLYDWHVRGQERTDTTAEPEWIEPHNPPRSVVTATCRRPCAVQGAHGRTDAVGSKADGKRSLGADKAKRNRRPTERHARRIDGPIHRAQSGI